MTMKLTSDSFRDGDRLKMDHVLAREFGFGCEGGNKSPQFAWSGAPTGTQSFAINCHDPDAPTGSGFWHWMVVNIPSTVTSLELGAGDADGKKLPQGALQIRTDFGKPGYGGPCPPPGANVHRYIFTLHAVKEKQLPVTADTSCAVVGFQLGMNTLATARLIGLFSR